MRRVNWNNVTKQTRLIKKNVKNVRAAGEYLKDIPEEGYFREEKTQELKKISECKSSTLRRYSKSLENFFYLVTSEQDRKKILAKQIEIQTELDSRLTSNE